MDKKSYTKPQIVDYGSIAEMTAGQMYHLKEDSLHKVGNLLDENSTGPCYPGITCSP